MRKNTSKKQFEKMLEKLLQEHERQMLSERIKNGMRQAKGKKSQMRS